MSTLFKNIKFSIITFSGQIISGSIIYIVLARLMSLNDFGLISFGTTLAGLIVVIAEFGFSLMAQRDIPQNRFPFAKYVYNTILQKVVLSILTLIGGCIYLSLFFKGDNLKIGLIFIVYALITAINMYFLAISRAKNRFKIESRSTLLYTLVILTVIICYLFFRYNVFFIALGLLFARLIQLAGLVFNYISEFSKNDLKYDKEIQSYLFKNSFSFGLQYVIGIFYLTIDSQLITFYFGNEAVAVYQSFFKIVLILLVVSDLLVNVFLPYLSAIYSGKENNFIQIASVFNKVIFSIGLILFVFLNLFAKDIVNFLYTGKYSSALTIVIPLSFVLLLRTCASIYAVLLTISEHQNVRLLVVFISLMTNISLNLLIIPKFGFVGAAYVSLVTHFVLLGLYSLYTYKFFDSFLINYRILIYFFVTIVLIIFKGLVKIEIGFAASIFVMFLWCLTLRFVYNKEQLKSLIKLIS